MRIVIENYEPKHEKNIFESEVEEALNTLFKADLTKIELTFNDEDLWKELKA